jgi:hypothetical protein
MVTIEVAVPLATIVVVPVMLELAATAAPAVKVTVPSALITGVAIERVFTSAVDEARVQLENPEVLVAEQAV